MVKLGDYTKEEVEDFTGRIPLFLEKCVVGDKIDRTLTSSPNFTHKPCRSSKRSKQNATAIYQNCTSMLLVLPTQIC
jgi:hypothetical protein